MPEKRHAKKYEVDAPIVIGHAYMYIHYGNHNLNPMQGSHFLYSLLRSAKVITLGSQRGLRELLVT